MKKRRHRVNYNAPGHAHQLDFCCDHNIPFLKAERTCEWLRDAIDEARQKLNFALWAYVFMPEHVHLIVCPRDAEYDVAAIRMKQGSGVQISKMAGQAAPDCQTAATANFEI